MGNFTKGATLCLHATLALLETSREKSGLLRQQLTRYLRDRRFRAGICTCTLAVLFFVT